MQKFAQTKRWSETKGSYRERRSLLCWTLPVVLTNQIIYHYENRKRFIVKTL